MATDPPRSTSFRTIFAGSIGNALEWYDFALFGYFAPILGTLFFPSDNPAASLVQTFGAFALGFVMRPVGGVLFGHIGDRWGRKTALRLSAILMAVPTTLIGLLPTYADVGVWAAVMLTACRVLQGLSVGGEMIGSISFLAEQAPPERRGFVASWTGVAGGGGSLVGSGVAALLHVVLSPEQLAGWGWRIPFLFGIGVGVFGLWLRTAVAESADFERAESAGDLARVPVMDALRRDRRALALTFFLATPFTLGFYLPFVWLPTWLTKVHEPPVGGALTANTIALAMMIALTPLWGMLSDRIGRKWVYLAGTVGVAAATYPIFLMLEHGSFRAALAGQMAFAFFMAMTGGALPALLVERFPTRTRFSGMAVGYNVNVALLGGTTPLVATALISLTGDPLSPALYLIAGMMLAAIAVLCVDGRHARPLE